MVAKRVYLKPYFLELAGTFVLVFGNQAVASSLITLSYHRHGFES